MARVEAMYRCNKCLDEFVAVSGQMTKCKCGACELEPREFSTSYINKEGERGVHFDTIESKTFYCEDEYFIMDDELKQMWDEIRSLSKYSRELCDKSADGKTFISKIVAEVESYNSFNECNTAKLEVYLKNSVKREWLKSKLIKYIEVIKAIRAKEIDLNDRDTMDEICYERTRERHDLYDYTFYF